MDHEPTMLHFACAAFTLAAWIWGLIALKRHSDAKRRRFRDGASQLAMQLGLAIEEEGVMQGEVDGVRARIEGTGITVRPRLTVSRRVGFQVHRVTVPCPPDWAWVVRDQPAQCFCDEEVPVYAEHIDHWTAKLGEGYEIEQRGAPEFAFWNDEQVSRSARESSLVLARADGGRLQATYRNDELLSADKLPELGSPARVKRALYTTLSMLSEERARLYVSQRGEPVSPAAPLPAAGYASGMSIFAGFVGIEIVGHPDHWPGFALGFGAAYFPLLLAVIGWRRLAKRRQGSSRSPT